MSTIVSQQQVSDNTEMSNLQSTSTNTFSSITLRNTFDEFAELKYSPHLVSFMYFQDTECMLNKYNKFCMLPLETTTHACIQTITKISTLSKQETSKRKRKEPDYSKEEVLVDEEDDPELKIIDACVEYPNKLVKKNKK